MVSLLLAAAMVTTAGLALYFDARGKAAKDDRMAASLEFMRFELQLFSGTLDVADKIAAAAVFGLDPVVFTPERALRWNRLVGGLDALSARGDAVGYLSLELVEDIAREAGDLLDFSEDFVLDYYRTAVALWNEFEPLTRSLVGEDRIDLIVGSQALFTTRRIRRAALRNQAEAQSADRRDSSRWYSDRCSRQRVLILRFLPMRL